jgi:serine/threonine protein kinase
MNCPPTDELERFLDGAPPATAADAVSAHVDGCGACQRRLEEISERVDAAPWRAAAEGARPISSSASLDLELLQAQKNRILATLDADEMPAATSTTANFTRLRRHAHGGLSEVFVFREEPLGRAVALKVLRARGAMLPELRRRFTREYRITSELDHPGVPPVYGVGRLADGRDFFTMRFVGGETLARRIARFHELEDARPARDDRRFRELLASFRTVCDTIDHAHRRGVVHRDLKPQNVQVEGRETVVLDWGLAKQSGVDEEDDSSLAAEFAGAHVTRFDERLGTPLYMSPEQAEGGSRRIDRQTDIYGLGAILFEVLTSQPPHAALLRELTQGDAVSEAHGGASNDDAVRRAARVEDLYRRIASGATPNARDAARRRVPPELCSICAKAMSRRPESRYGSAAELADEVDRWLASQPVEAHRYGALERSWLWIARHRGLAASAALLLVTVTIVASLAAALVTTARVEARRTAVQAQQERVLASANLVAEMLAGEIDLRWRILEAEAASRELVELLASLEGDPESDSEGAARSERLARLRAWSDRRYADHSLATRATSWFVLDRAGTLLARNPQSDRSAEVVGGNFRFRDYFHGAGRDLGLAEAEHAQPLVRPYRSTVFRSQITGTYMVAFSVPIWREASDDGDAAKARGRGSIGVLGMTIEMGRFDSLQRGAAQGQVLVLADRRENFVGGSARRGLILHHPSFVKPREEDGVRTAVPLLTLDEQRVAATDRLDTYEVERQRALNELAWRERLELEKPRSADSLDVAYVDPAGGHYAGPWVAGFAPVVIKGRSQPLQETGLVVLVQERPE